MVAYRSPREWEIMREAGRVVAHALRAARDAAGAGVQLRELDAIAAKTIAAMGAEPAFLHYHPSWAPAPYPATIGVSVNDVAVHGVPDGRTLRAGDLVSLNCGASVRGYHGDAAVTFTVGAPSAADRRLIEVAEECLARAIARAVPGNRLGDVAHAVESTARAAGFGVVEGSGGHGIGTAMHEEPQVANTGRPGRGLRIRPGLTIAIEPMISAGRDGSRVLADGWSVATRDGSRAAHVEHSVAVTEDGPVVLTLP
ncbi:Methionine aminopeptidase 1 [Actinomadura rubteroloni]|uniref:Methionine aminopeptidase n=1 Tax=Actinomadura rubteroloni TaxID=1926885 RepID=A0A2P4UK62_9ACTN|nr:type I methionyl aminopeptidase [Actinomadura rubteroloni]POM25452.1 Methionine aminopeptidase 1 [Actinomadura rubteroloni]